MGTQEGREVCRKYILPEHFILAISSADPRKNIKRLIHSYSRLPSAMRDKCGLVIVWTHHLLTAEMSECVTELHLDNQVIFLPQVSDEDLALLYNAASLFVFPSLYEGFGLPLLEAMASGIPVIAADNSSIPEVVGDAAILFDARDVEAMANAIARVLVDNTLRLRLIQKGFEQVASFSWEKCAYLTLSGYQRAALST